MKLAKPDFVIYAPPYEETSGGVILLHLLCKRLRELGFNAAMWPKYKPISRINPAKSAAWVLRGRRQWKLCDPFQNPIASIQEARKGVVIYPETISGNPLKAAKVVRWLLHKPGFHSGEYAYGDNDLMMYHEKHFDVFGLSEKHHLNLTYINPIYQNEGRFRRGSAYIIRKWKGRLDQHPKDAILVDRLSPHQIADVFNRVERVFSYDHYTMLNRYAAICGAIPIVIPSEGMTADQWLPNAADRAGVAWGEDDVNRASATREDLLRQMSERRMRDDEMILRLVDLCRHKATWSAH